MSKQSTATVVFEAKSITIAGVTYAAEYSVTPKGTIAVFARFGTTGPDMKLYMRPDMAGYQDALAAAKAAKAVPAVTHDPFDATVKPATGMPISGAQPKAEKPAVKKPAATKPAQPKAEKPAAKAAQPKAEKPAAKAAQPKAEKPAAKAATKPAQPKAEKPAAKAAQPKAEKPAAKAATKPAQPKAEKPAVKAATKPDQPKAEKPAVKAATKPAQPKAEKPAAVKSAAASLPMGDKSWLGQVITGKGWTISADEASGRIRVAFANGKASGKAEKAVLEAGFFWAPSMGSYNRGLKCKAWRAALELAETLKALK